MIDTRIEAIKSMLRSRLGSLERSLLEPADEAEIAAAEQAMGVHFPEELKQLYSIHNGESHSSPGLFFGLQFLTLQEMVREWKIWSDLHAEYGDMGDHYSIPSDWIKEQYINHKWIPFCHDGGGNHLGIDLDPGPKGIVGQVINFGRDEETKFVIARNIGEFIQFLHDTVRDENYTVQQEDGVEYWIYGRDEQARLLRDAQHYAFASDGGKNSDLASDDELNTWTVELSPDWQERIERDYGSWKQFIELYQIYLPNENISDIRPLSRCTEVRELSLARNHIVDLSPLAGCEELKKLYLTHNPVEDLSPLSQLPYLRQLDISDTQVNSLQPLAELKRLVELECNRIPATDYRPLLAIPTLECLTLSNPNVEQASIIGQMEQLRTLTVIEAGEWNREAWELLSKCSLVSLTVTGVEWKNMQHLSCFTQLKQLTLANVSIDDLSALSEFPCLQKVKLAGDNRIANLESLAQSTTLTSFTGNQADVDLLQNAFKQPVDFSVQYDARYNK